jgi:hypothetical protein
LEITFTFRLTNQAIWCNYIRYESHPFYATVDIKSKNYFQSVPNWNFFAFSPFPLLTLLGGWASRVSLWGGSETWGNSRLARSRKIPHCGNLKAKTKLCSYGQSP